MDRTNRQFPQAGKKAQGFLIIPVHIRSFILIKRDALGEGEPSVVSMTMTGES